MPSDQELLFIRYNFQFASIALLYYDYSLTWTREVKYFWFRKPNLSTILYFCCRYAMVSNVLYVLAVSGVIRNCEAAYQLCSSLGLVGRIGILTVWGARTYAVFNRHRGVLAFIAALGFSRLVFSIVHVPFVSCVRRPKAFLGIPSELLAIMTMVDEIILAALATCRIYCDIKATGLDKSTKKGLMYLVMEQGLLYLFFVTLLACGTIAFYNLEGVMFEPLLNAFTIPVSGMMTCRFLIHLREWEDSRSGIDQTTIDFVAEPIHFREPIKNNDTPLGWSQHLRQDPLLSFGVSTGRDYSESEEPHGPERV